jgi:hypothetical protein
MKLPDRLFKSSQISNFIKIHPVGAELFHADRRIDMTQLIVAFRNFANAPDISNVQYFVTSVCDSVWDH